MFDPFKIHFVNIIRSRRLWFGGIWRNGWALSFPEVDLLRKNLNRWTKRL